MRPIFPVAIIALLCLIGTASAADSIPVLPANFYGHVYIGGQLAPQGTLVTAQFNGVMSSAVTVDSDGEYDNLAVNLPADYSPGSGLPITFYINGVSAGQVFSAMPGSANEVDLPVGSTPVTTTTTPIPTETTPIPTETTITTTTTTPVPTQTTTTTTTTTPIPTGEIPVIPHVFYGTVTVLGQPAPVGTIIEARGTGVSGSSWITVTTVGQYGVPGDMGPKLKVEGQIPDGTPIEFYVNGEKARVFLTGGPLLDSYPFEAAQTTELNIQTAMDMPVADFVAVPNLGTAPLTVQFTDLSTGHPTEWAWDFQTGTSTDQNPTYSYNGAGRYTVSLTVTNAMGTDTKTTVDCVIVNPHSGPSGGGGGGYTGGDQYISTWINPTPNVTTVATPTPTTTSGGGENNIPYNNDGTVRHATSVGSPDGIANLAISEGSTLTSAGGIPVFRVSITRVTTGVPPVPAGALFAYAGYAYDLQPDGTTFEPAATLSFTIPENDWAKLGSQDLSMKWYNPTSKAWENLPTSVDKGSRTVSTRITHMSIFALFTAIQPTPVPTTAVITTVPTTTPAPPMFGEDFLTSFLRILVIVIIIVAVILVVYYFIRRRRKEGGEAPPPAPSIDEDADWMNLK